MELGQVHTTEPGHEAKGKEIESFPDQRRAELELKLAETKIRLHELESSRTNWSLIVSPVGATIIVGILGALVAMYGNWNQGRVNQQLERAKFESALILSATATPDAEQRAKNLLFFVEAGLINDSEGKIRKLLAQPSSLPITPVSELELQLQFITQIRTQIANMVSALFNASASSEYTPINDTVRTLQELDKILEIQAHRIDVQIQTKKNDQFRLMK